MKLFDYKNLIPSSYNMPAGRRDFLKDVTFLGALALLSSFVPACAQKTGSETETNAPGNNGKNPGSEVFIPGVSAGLPAPKTESDVSIEETLLTRRSIREYKNEKLTLQEVSQILWAAQGTTSTRGFRTAPSASATYPLETYLIVGNVDGLETGVYRYQTKQHDLFKVLDEDKMPLMTRTHMGRYFVEGGAIYLVFTGIYSRTGVGDEAKKFVHMEVGHAAQNVYLQAISLGLGTVVIGGFSAKRTSDMLDLSFNETPLYWMPVARI